LNDRGRAADVPATTKHTQAISLKHSQFYSFRAEPEYTKLNAYNAIPMIMDHKIILAIDFKGYHKGKTHTK